MSISRILPCVILYKISLSGAPLRQRTHGLAEGEKLSTVIVTPKVPPWIIGSFNFRHSDWHAEIEPVPVVDHVEHGMGLFGELHHLLPVLQHTPLEPNNLRPPHIVEPSIPEAALHLGLPYILDAIEKLPVKVVVVHLVVIYNNDLLDAKAEEVDDDDGTEASCTQAEEGLGGEELLVPAFDADLTVENCV